MAISTWQILITIVIVLLSLITIYFFLKRKKDKINQRSSEAIERMQIREYGRKINNITREKKSN